MGFPVSQDRDKSGVRTPVEYANNRMAMPQGEPDSVGEKHERNQAVGPRIQTPLTAPDPHGDMVEGPQVKDGPKIHRRRTAGPNKIAEDVEMDHEKGNEENAPPFLGKRGEEQRNKQGPKDTVEQVMVVAGIELSWFESGSLGCQIDD